MSQERSVKWESETGSIKLKGNGKEERAFTMSRAFVEEFRKELISTTGDATFKMAMRKLLEKLGTPDASEPNWEAFEKINDDQIVPVSTEGIPPEVKWDGKSRNLTFDPGLDMAVWTLSSFQNFKDILTEILTEKGAHAMINGAGKKAGLVAGPEFAKHFGWSDLAGALGSIGETIPKLYALMGWGKATAATQKGADGKDMIVINVTGSYEADGKKTSAPGCTVAGSFLNGLWSSLADTLGGMAAEVREVACSAKGDKHCSFAVKFKDKGATPLDWKELTSEWQALAG